MAHDSFGSKLNDEDCDKCTRIVYDIYYARINSIRQKETQDILNYLRRNCCKELLELNIPGFVTVDEENKDWTLADLFLRQYLNNGVDGIGLNNISSVYTYLVTCKFILIKYKMIYAIGENNSGYVLWNNYNFDAETN